MNEYAKALASMNNLITVIQSQTTNIQEMFFDNTPKDISLKRLDSNGDVVDVVIPNIAKMTESMAVSEHDHDERYLETVAITGALNAKANKTHNHDSSYSAVDHEHSDLYYQEYEVNNLLNAKADADHTHQYASGLHNHENQTLPVSRLSGYSTSGGEIRKLTLDAHHVRFLLVSDGAYLYRELKFNTDGSVTWDSSPGL